MPEPSQRPAIATAPISVILFAHALSTETADAIKGWQAYLDKLRRPHEILVIQETRPEVAPPEEPTTPTSATSVFTYERNVGYRDAFNSTIASVQHPLLVFCSCDKQYQPSDVEGLLKLIDHVDLVVGYRKWGQAPPWRVLLDLFGGLFSRIVLGIPLEPRVCWLGGSGWGRRWVARWVFGVRVQDPECPFRLARREIFQHMPIQARGPFLQVEMLAKANHLTCLLAEEGVTWATPALPSSDAIPFGQDAFAIFRHPEFGPFVNSAPVETPPQIPVAPPT